MYKTACRFENRHNSPEHIAMERDNKHAQARYRGKAKARRNRMKRWVDGKPRVKPFSYRDICRGHAPSRQDVKDRANRNLDQLTLRG